MKNKNNNQCYKIGRIKFKSWQNNVAAVRLMCVDSNGKECYLIKTSTLYNTESLLKKKLLCANDH